MWFDKPGLSDYVFVDPTFISRYFITTLVTSHISCVMYGILRKKVHQTNAGILIYAPRIMDLSGEARAFPLMHVCQFCASS